jgi:hypothetical protein
MEELSTLRTGRRLFQLSMRLWIHKKHESKAHKDQAIR